MSENTYEILDMMIIFERKLSELYGFFALDDSPDKTFWKQLSNEEIVHADVLKTFKELSIRNNLQLNLQIFSPNALKTMLKYIDELFDAEMEHKHTMLQMFSIAYDLEKSLIEKNYFAVLESNSPEAKQLLARLKNETSAHMERIKLKLDQLKKV